MARALLVVGVVLAILLQACAALTIVQGPRIGPPCPCAPDLLEQFIGPAPLCTVPGKD